jgi:hypothetical protein
VKFYVPLATLLLSTALQSGVLKVNSVTETQQVVRQLVGTRTLVSWSEEKSDGKKSYPLAPDAVGQII